MRILLSENIKKFRELNHLSQKQLAEKLGTEEAAVIDWENGTTVPDAQMLKELGRIFSCPADLLLDDTELDKTDRLMRKKWNFILISVYSVLLMICGLTLYIINRYFSNIPGLEGEISNYEPYADYLSLFFMLASVLLFAVNLIRNKTKRL